MQILDVMQELSSTDLKALDRTPLTFTRRAYQVHNSPFKSTIGAAFEESSHVHVLIIHHHPNDISWSLSPKQAAGKKLVARIAA